VFLSLANVFALYRIMRCKLCQMWPVATHVTWLCVCLSDGMKQLNHSRCLGCRPPPKNPFRLGWAEERNHVACLLDGGTYGASWQIQLNDLNTFSTEVLDAAYPRSSVLSLLARNLFLISCSALGLYACERL